MTGRRRPEIIAASLFLLLGVLYLADAVSMPVGTARAPGAGLFPLAVGGLILACALALPFVGTNAAPVAWPAWSELRRVGTATAALVGFCLALPWTGYLLPTAAVLAVTIRLFGGRSWRGATAVSVGLALASYYLFAVLLGIRLEPLPVWR